ncbi:MAG: hypothetical protein H7249_04400 [Chitinophagaceae bacterium]|nr:hypothetical protein [Oligoflexus sp.]
MSLQVMAKVLAHVQRFGTGEDILTSIFATMLAIDRDFSARLFSIALAESGAALDQYHVDFPEVHGVITADKVSKKRYAWIEDKRIAFAPDIWIFDPSADEWDEVKPRPKPSFHFLIECKESARITKGQARGYPFFEDDLFGKSAPRVFTMLCGDAAAEEKEKFSYHVSWLELSTIFKECVPAAKNQEAIASLVALYDYHLNFDSTAQETNGDSEAAQALLEWIRGRLPCEGTIEPRGNPSAKPLGKWLCLSSDQKLQLWLRADRKDGAYHVQIETWTEQAMIGKPTKLSLASVDSAEGWNQLLFDIMNGVQSFSEGNV